MNATTQMITENFRMAPTKRRRGRSAKALKNKSWIDNASWQLQEHRIKLKKATMYEEKE